MPGFHRMPFLRPASAGETRVYRWAELKQRGYDWWVKRMSWALESCDIIRLDHFRGFQQYWEIPNSEPTAVHGRWVDGPGEDLFRVLRERLGDLPFIAEDLGSHYTRGVRAARPDADARHESAAIWLWRSWRTHLFAASL